MCLGMVVGCPALGEVPGGPGVEVSLIPIAYFLGSFGGAWQLWGTAWGVVWSTSPFILAGAGCAMCCGHRPLAPFFMAGVSSPVLNRWALKLQQLNIKFEYIQDKKSVVADKVSWLRSLGLYQDKQ